MRSTEPSKTRAPADACPGRTVAPTIPHPWVDSSASPFYVTRWPVSSPGDDVVAYFDVVRRSLPLIDFPWATVLDFSAFDAGASTTAQRRVFVEEAESVRERVAERCVAIAVVAPTALARAVVSAVHWMIPSPVPFQVFDTAEAAEAWVWDCLRAAAA